MQLCSNRREGFGPSSSISSPIPTSCFVDIILIPLPIWLAIALLPILFALSLRHRKQNYNPSTAYLRAVPQRNWGFTITSAVYYILIVANGLMMTLEIVRLELIHFGIGLLPFVYAGLIIAMLLYWSEGVKGRIRGWQAVNAVVWIGGVAVSAVKVIGLSKEGIDSRKGSKYPLSDQVIDVAVMAGVYAVVAILEVVLSFWRASRQARRDSDQSPQSGMSPVMDNSEYLGKFRPSV
ncbi:hypothetical protein ONS95_011655 [Cadophora gregata]|uniref:uncharacterized protein n=1 Tax=Cadophora gregata TaxID=51156 RepID=UPI0026DBCDD6|nr:uncharacterized protein ONS95_011655 [Cadophora gregata]KAK0120249.1 hypothetical protein ONS95_011655 [Cadophora gregata]KAK0121285.1 hypothetical protein ONS96_011459 [Cadophora gregata f. sp. sojae]